MNQDKRFIEDSRFPAGEVNEYAAREKIGGARPPLWEMAFWWTRKPLIGARAAVAASLLPAGVDVGLFKRMIGLGGRHKTPHRNNPLRLQPYSEAFSRVRLLDPFAGFGSIPLEAVRLGVGEVVAAELLPTAYVFLKAVLEYPKLFGERLVKEVERWGNWILEQLRADPELRGLYDEEVAVYIGSWEVRCPHCGKYTPLVGNWWLARVKKGSAEEEEGEEGGAGVYERLAWMEPVVSGDRVLIRVRDLNSELGLKAIRAKVDSRSGVVEAGGQKYRVPRPNIEAEQKTATCLHCNNTIGKSGGEWYVKRAIMEWNRNLEAYLRGEIALQQLLESPARPVILARVSAANGLQFSPAQPQDTEKLWKALEKLKQIWGDPDVPTEELWKYTASGGGALSIWIWGFDKFYKLFNPRQLLTLVKLVKLIREAGRRVEEEKLREGWSREEAFRYAEDAEAVTTYLAIALCKFVYLNSIVNRWDGTWLKIGESMSERGIAMNWNWVDVKPYSDFTGSWIKSYNAVLRGVSYLVSAISGSPSGVRVLLDDATTLSRLRDERFDVIVTDPPYADDVPYTELSDFYYVWLKRALSDVGEGGGVKILVPRFHGDAFFPDGVELTTQWEFLAHREVSENDGRLEFFRMRGAVPRDVRDGMEYFRRLLSDSFKAMAGRLKDDGLLVAYYSHTSPEAWEALLEAGWRSAGMRVSAAHVFVTESAQRVTARGKSSLDVSIVTVWRKGVSGEALVDEVYARARDACRDFATRVRQEGRRGVDLFVSVLGCVLSEFTRYRNIVGVKGVEDLVEKYVYPATAEAIALSLGGEEFGGSVRPETMLYMLAKHIAERGGRQARRKVDRSTFRILLIGTRSDEDRVLKAYRIFDKADSEFVLLEPSWTARGVREAVEDALRARGLVGPEVRVRCTVDALHLLEYYALVYPSGEFKRRFEDLSSRYPSEVREAVALAKILYRILGEGDPERDAVSRLLDYVAPGRRGLEAYMG